MDPSHLDVDAIWRFLHDETSIGRATHAGFARVLTDGATRGGDDGRRP